MAEMLELGAPALPDGYFYRVKITSFGSLHIEIREKTKFFSYMHAELYADPARYPEYSAQEIIRRASLLVHKDWLAVSDSRLKRQALRKWEGDHK
jgi:hypothetical protein